MYTMALYKSGYKQRYISDYIIFYRDGYTYINDVLKIKRKDIYDQGLNKIINTKGYKIRHIFFHRDFI